MAKFVWISCGPQWNPEPQAARLVEAKDQDEAYRKVLAERMAKSGDLQDEVDLFDRFDRILPLEDVVSSEPLEGPVPEPSWKQEAS